jgi:hypothetical protein
MIATLKTDSLFRIQEKIELEVLFVDLLLKRLNSSDYILHNQFRFEYIDTDGSKYLLGTDVSQGKQILNNEIGDLKEMLEFETNSLSQHMDVADHPFLCSIKDRIRHKEHAIQLLEGMQFNEPEIVTWYRIWNPNDASCFINNFEVVLEVEGIYWWGIEMGIEELPYNRIEKISTTTSNSTFNT